MKKLLLIGMVLMLGVSSAGFSARHDNRKPGRRPNESHRNDNERRYNQIYSKYSSRINSLESSLRNKENEIRREKIQKRVNWRRVERLNSEKNSIRRELNSTHAQLRRELERNKLTAYGPRR
jgi:Skp family chaperone for outer membrane proteins